MGRFERKDDMIWRKADEEEQQARKATQEGRRIYVGHIDYAVKIEDIYKLFSDHEFPAEKVDMSVDPFTGRNPGYCFVEVRSAGRAARAIHDLDGMIFPG